MPTKDNTTNKEVVTIKVTGWLDSFGSTYNGIISFIKGTFILDFAFSFIRILIGDFHISDIFVWRRWC